MNQKIIIFDIFNIIYLIYKLKKSKFTMPKITKTYSVEQRIYEAFEQVADENNINKSSFIEGCINKYVTENKREFVNKVYILKTNPEYTTTIIAKDDTFYFLKDGSKIPIILFLQMYKEVDEVNADKFFSESGVSQLAQDFLKTGYEDSEKINS
jgi:hypothetical protein